MTTITVVVQTQPTALPAGQTFGAINVAVKDNSGVTLNGVLLNGKETPPWTAVFSGATGSNEVLATLQALDTSGKNLGNPVVVTETGSGGFPATYPGPMGASITVTGS